MAKLKYNKIEISKDWDLDKLRNEGEKFNDFILETVDNMLKSGRDSYRKMIRRVKVQKEKEELFTLIIELKKSSGDLSINYVYTAPNGDELISLEGSYKNSKEAITDVNKVLDTLDDKFYKIKKKKINRLNKEE